MIFDIENVKIMGKRKTFNKIFTGKRKSTSFKCIKISENF